MASGSRRNATATRPRAPTGRSLDLQSLTRLRGCRPTGGQLLSVAQRQRDPKQGLVQSEACERECISQTSTQEDSAEASQGAEPPLYRVPCTDVQIHEHASSAETLDDRLLQEGRVSTKEARVDVRFKHRSSPVVSEDRLAFLTFRLERVFAKALKNPDRTSTGAGKAPSTRP